MAVAAVANPNEPNELAHVLIGTGVGALAGMIRIPAAMTAGIAPAAVGAVFGGAFTMSFLLIDRGLEALIGNGALARIIRLVAAIIGSVAVATSVTTALTGVSLTFSSGLALSLAMAVTAIVLPFLACCLIPCVPFMPFIACGLLVATL
jgi:hypothetical protein